MRLTRFAWLLSLGICVLGLPSDVLGQGTFQNLDFEAGTFVPIPGDPHGSVYFTTALPGWTGYLGNSQINWVLHNDLFLGTAGIAIWGPDHQPNYLHGRYYVVLQGGLDPTGPPAWVPAALAQTGVMPSDALSIRLYSPSQFALGITTTFDGIRIPLYRIGPTANGAWEWGGDISAHAGHSGELRFTGNDHFDFIQLSPVAIPEPSTLGLLSFGSAVLAWSSRRRRA